MKTLPFEEAICFPEKATEGIYFWYICDALFIFLGTQLLTINNLLFKAQIDNINLFKVVSKNNDAAVMHSGCHLLSRFIILILVTEILWEEPDQQKGTQVVLYKCWLLDDIL